MKENILIVDDEESICQTLKGILSDEGYNVLVAGSGEDALKIMEDELPQLVMLDIWLPGIDGLETLKRIKAQYPDVMVIMMSGHGTIETAVKATKLGAFDFIEKPLSLEKVIILINNALNVLRLEAENVMLKQKIAHQYELTGVSKQITELKEMISIVAPTNAWILIMGENGTGKELVARSIHHLSHRAHKPIVEVNCAAIPEELIESELFGHEKGAFTGATEKKRGKFDLAHEGTIFLDEVADMSLKAQAKILRILQEKKFERVGGNKLIDMDVRVLAATNKDLEKEMEAGRFRQDLYYRLHVIPLYVPTLRERKEDIKPLAEKFLQDAAEKEGEDPKILTDEALAVLMEHDWPGNVRELKNIIERLVILTPAREITANNIPPLQVRDFGKTPFVMEDNISLNVISNSLKDAKLDFERQFILKKLEENEGNISKTAEAIGLERSNLHKKLRSMKLVVKE
ncbi:MAG TPA: sigma-54 dependent transcriptional regulator [Smithellaceae bacterium]|nr:sigma-54 dependent transcriptional regulator [Smithellaceae bacterium]HRS88688.1 sigma-54 dependent transcriptional regulator [Smithellaceae bacterium]HRV26746.1 sigma-54 dependent transcriptional regulator [Smithellaceae bacterium]